MPEFVHTTRHFSKAFFKGPLDVSSCTKRSNLYLLDFCQSINKPTAIPSALKAKTSMPFPKWLPTPVNGDGDGEEDPAVLLPVLLVAV